MGEYNLWFGYVAFEAGTVDNLPPGQSSSWQEKFDLMPGICVSLIDLNRYDSSMDQRCTVYKSTPHSRLLPLVFHCAAESTFFCGS